MCHPPVWGIRLNIPVHVCTVYVHIHRGNDGEIMCVMTVTDSPCQGLPLKTMVRHLPFPATPLLSVLFLPSLYRSYTPLPSSHLRHLRVSASHDASQSLSLTLARGGTAVTSTERREEERRGDTKKVDKGEEWLSSVFETKDTF